MKKRGWIFLAFWPGSPETGINQATGSSPIDLEPHWTKPFRQKSEHLKYSFPICIVWSLVRLQPSTILGGVLLGSGRHKLHWLGPNHSQVSHDESFGSYRSISFQTKQEVYRDLRNLALLGLHVYSPIPTSHHSQWHDLCRGKFIAVKIPSTHIFIETAEVTAKKTPFSVCVVLKFVSLWLQRWDEQEMSELSSPEARWCVRAHCCAIFLCYLGGDI